MFRTEAQSVAGERSSTTELRERLAAARAGTPFLIHHDAKTGQRIVVLAREGEHVLLGRGERCAVRLMFDPEVSRLHAELRRIGDDWVISDDGLSRNGTFVNEERLHQRRRLIDGDVIRCGNTSVSFQDRQRRRATASTLSAGEPTVIS